MRSAHILIVEDDADTRQLLETLLRTHGFETTAVGGVEAAIAAIEAAAIDLVLLDLILPGQSGLDLCRRLWASGGPPIIIVTALSDPADRVIGLELGADDYITKPFDPRELLARIRTVLRRMPAGDPERTLEVELRFSGCSFVPQRRLLRSPEGLRISLTGAEADLLFAFCEHPREVLSRNRLIDLSRGRGFAIAERSVDALVSRLRQKIASAGVTGDVIRTARAYGYEFLPDVDPA